ncbi:MAG TPA: acetyl-CoA carboxylase biotin carboxyl carrier protein subunit [Burkholderiaceae bacterium]|nr:acetyl-CoA carboxylase biotin carboxyl carrier protein subunit [Burkholderiaceae bacterium]
MAMVRIEVEVTGKVWKIEKQPGERVEAGEAVLILESMKMEIPVEAPQAGVVRDLKVAEGDVVSEGQVVVSVET